MPNFVKVKWMKTKILCLGLLIKCACFVKYSVRVLILNPPIPSMKMSSPFEKYGFHSQKRLFVYRSTRISLEYQLPVNKHDVFVCAKTLDSIHYNYPFQENPCELFLPSQT